MVERKVHLIQSSTYTRMIERERNKMIKRTTEGNKIKNVLHCFVSASFMCRRQLLKNHFSLFVH